MLTHIELPFDSLFLIVSSNSFKISLETIRNNEINSIKTESIIRQFRRWTLNIYDWRCIELYFTKIQNSIRYIYTRRIKKRKRSCLYSLTFDPIQFFFCPQFWKFWPTTALQAGGSRHHGVPSLKPITAILCLGVSGGPTIIVLPLCREV